MFISANDLRPFPSLVFLDLWNNQLFYIDGDLFMYTPRLQYVNFGYNRIQLIGHDLVNNLHDLFQLYFQANVCINQYAYNSSGVLLLAPQLSVLCPPLDATTAKPMTTTEINANHCMCDKENLLRIQVDSQNRKIVKQNEEIEQLQQSNEQKSEEIEKLIVANAAFEKRLLEVEMGLTPEFYFVKK